jgi:D-alanyl-D-alanine dipeptidase
LVNFSENELDMGTEFDCFENERNTITTIFWNTKKNRRLLKSVMLENNLFKIFWFRMVALQFSRCAMILRF